MTERRHLLSMGNHVKAHCLLAACCAFAGCSPSQGPPVRIVVAAGFRGPVTILERDDGADVYPEKGVYVYGVPTNGTLVVASLEPFRVWHQIDAVVSPLGIALAVRQTNEPETTPGEITLYELASPGREIRFFVGTQAEMLAYVQKPVFETEAARWWAGQLTNGANPSAKP